jgi:carbon monoxide dehydrogenase subunit G
VFRLSQSIEIDRPAEVVWEYLIAFEQVGTWEHGIVEVRQVTPGPARLGTEISARRIFAGRTVDLRGSIVAFEDGRTATMALSGGPIAMTEATYTVDPIEAGRSRVTYAGEGRLRSALRLMEPMVPALGRAEARKNLARLRRRVDAGIPPRSNVPTPPG